MEVLKSDGLTFELVYDPLKTLPADSKDKLVRECVPLTKLAFENPEMKDEMIILKTIEAVSSGVYMRDNTGRLIGCHTLRTECIMKQRIIHFQSVAVLPEYSQRGFIHCLGALNVLKEAERYDSASFFIGARTQNPRAYIFLMKTGLYPRPGEPTPEHLKSLAEAYARVIQEKYSIIKTFSYDRERMVLKGVYGRTAQDGKDEKGSIYTGGIPWTRNEAVNDFVRNNLDMSNGDAFVCLGPFIRENYIRMLGDNDTLLKRFA